MKKTELIAMTGTAATDQMMQKAMGDIPEVKKYGNYVSVRFSHEVIMGAEIHGNILIVNFYLTLNLRAGGRVPIYTVFLEKDSDSFLTYDYLNKKWREATLGRLAWPNCHYDKDTYVGDADRKVIADFLKTVDGTYWDIERYQDKIRERQLLARHKAETDRWDEVMKQVPPLPKDWNRWVARTAVTRHFIFYKYARHVSEGYCTRCKKMVPVSKPRHNKMGTCPRCRKRILYKSTGRAGWIRTDTETAYLLQPFGERFIIRQFEVDQRIREGAYMDAEPFSFEIRRVIVDDRLKGEVYYYGCYKQSYNRWIRQEVQFESRGLGYYASYRGQVYLRNLPALNRRMLSRTGLYEYAKRRRVIDPEVYFLRLKEYPYLEQLSKAGLDGLVGDVLKGKPVAISEAHSLKKMLGIDSMHLKKLIKRNGGIEYLEWLQEEKRQQKGNIPDQVIEWFVSKDIRPGNLCFIRDRMSLIQIYNYLKRQTKQSRQDVKHILWTWTDYLSMAGRLGMDVNDPIIYRTSKLLQRHNEAVLLMEKHNFEIREAELNRTFPDVSTVCSRIKAKYEYLEDETYAVLVPKGIRDIMAEGRTLHHCVGSAECYYDRICRQETYILFLRKKENLQEPYYTLEVEPGGVIRQKRTEYDRQKDDIQDVTSFLKKWQRVIAGRLSDSDLQIAEDSRDMRNWELDEMRKTGVRIQGGIFGGQLLADVLEEDLMETEQLDEAA